MPGNIFAGLMSSVYQTVFIFCTDQINTVQTGFSCFNHSMTCDSALVLYLVRHLKHQNCPASFNCSILGIVRPFKVWQTQNETLLLLFFNSKIVFNSSLPFVSCEILAPRPDNVSEAHMICTSLCRHCPSNQSQFWSMLWSAQLFSFFYCVVMCLKWLDLLVLLPLH